MTNTTPLPRKFFARNTHVVARDLLGKILVRKINGKTFSGTITEVECYVGFNDLASHAARGKTSRNEVMFGDAGHAYVYLIYGMYNCLNIVTGKKDFPAAILIRALQPCAGIPLMQRRRKTNNAKQLTAGPGKLCQALDIDRSLNGGDMTSSKKLFVTDGGQNIKASDIACTARIGVQYAGASAQLPWRYLIQDSPFVSRRIAVT